MSIQYNTLFVPAIQQPFHLGTVYAADTDDLFPGRVAGNDLNMGFGDRQGISEEFYQSFISSAVYGRGSESDLEPAARHRDDLVLRGAGLDPDRQRN